MEQGLANVEISFLMNTELEEISENVVAFEWRYPDAADGCL